MFSEWKRVLLGEIFELENSRVGTYSEEPEVFSVTKHVGFVPAFEYFGKRVASDALHRYKLVAPGEWAYSTIHIDEGSIARNTLGRPGVVSPMYTTMRVKCTRVVPFYLELLLRSPQMLAVYGDAQQGSVNRRRSLPWKKFAEIEVRLPPVTVQHRVASLIDTVDHTLKRATEAHETSSEIERLVRERLLQGDEPTSVGDILTLTKQPVRVAPDEVYTEVGVRSHGRGYFVKDPVTGAEIGKKKVFRMQPGALAFSVVFSWEGAVAKLDEGVTGKIASHRFPNYTSKHEAGVDLMAHFFQTGGGRELLVDCSPGGAGRNKTLNFGRLMETVVSLPPQDRWREIVGTLGAAKERTAAAARYEQSLRDLRANLLTALLSGEHEIPESYDELLDGEDVA